MSDPNREAVEAAAKGAYEAYSNANDWEHQPEYNKFNWRKIVTGSLTAALPFLAPQPELLALRAAWKIAEPHLPQDVYRRALAALEIKS